jgi:uncharacterized protein YjiS (DUF1127 family)
MAVAYLMHSTTWRVVYIRASTPREQAFLPRSQDQKIEEIPMNPIRIAKNWISYRRTINELGGLSNQALNDIGLTRHDIRNVAARSFR